MNIHTCLIPSQFCGNETKSVPINNLKENIKYTSRGTPLSCMNKGIGVGIHIEKKSHMSPLSLQQIKFIGEQYNIKFSKKKIRNITDLIKYMKTHTKSQNEKLLKDVLTMKNNNVDYKAYNSVIHYLYYSNEVLLSKLPFCKKIQ